MQADAISAENNANSGTNLRGPRRQMMPLHPAVASDVSPSRLSRILSLSHRSATQGLCTTNARAYIYIPVNILKDTEHKETNDILVLS